MTAEKKTTPELLAPAGTREALEAAIHAGADAVYFGGSQFNARMAADNFAADAMRDAIRTCAYYGVKSNITLNTLPLQREQAQLLRFAEQLYLWGADAIICADLGTARLLHRYFPDLALHASTQCAGHNTDAARFFASIGFSRMVAARELSFADLSTLCLNSPIETELFIHGAICVSQSGGCLFSSLVGGRSGNRGACAQPCRLPYRCTTQLPHPVSHGKSTGSGEAYPLSLRDMCLASHIPQLLSLGAASFKIEGRMKSPAYVRGVVTIYRRLLDERRSADKAELAQLAALFSRNGFTDGYFRGKTGTFMQGVRTERDKAATQQAERDVLSGRPAVRRIPVRMAFRAVRGMPMTLTMGDTRASVTVTGPIAAPAQTDSTSRDSIQHNLTRLGQTAFSAQALDITCDAGIYCPPSVLNDLRRQASARLDEALRAYQPYPQRTTLAPRFTDDGQTAALTMVRHSWAAGENTPYPFAYQASFLSPDSIPPQASAFYAIRYLPLEVFARHPAAALARGVNGVILPPVIFDSEWQTVRTMLQTAADAGICHALVGNVGHIEQARAFGFTLHGSLRCNIYTGLSADVWAQSGMTDLLLSPELSGPQLRDVAVSVPKGAVTYGRIPLMTLQRCIIREAAGIRDGSPCSHCDKHPFAALTDRRNTVFPVTRTFAHRNILWNSAPLYMADKPEHIAAMGLDFEHHLFTTETEAQIAALLRVYQNGGAGGSLPAAFRRI